MGNTGGTLLPTPRESQSTPLQPPRHLMILVEVFYIWNTFSIYGKG
jgi:hypothetical protein